MNTTTKHLLASEIASKIEAHETSIGNTFLKKIELESKTQRFIIITKLDEEYANFKRLIAYFKNSQIHLKGLTLKHFKNTKVTHYNFTF